MIGEYTAINARVVGIREKAHTTASDHKRLVG
jgi:hypothetical protein